MTPEEVSHLIQCMKCGNVVLYTAKDIIEAFEKKIEDARLQERSECAKIAELMYDCLEAKRIAQAIRGRDK